MKTNTNALSPKKIATLTKPGHYRDGNGLYLQVSKWGTKSWVFKFTVPTYEKGEAAMKSIVADGAPKRVRGKLRSMGLGSVFDYGNEYVEDRAVAPELEKLTLADVIAKPNDLRLDEVRNLVAALNKSVKAGIDPIKERALLELRKQHAAMAEAEAALEAEKVARAEEAARALAEARKKTFAQAVEGYLVKKDKELENDRHRQTWRSSLYAYAMPIIGDLNVDEITMEDVLRVLIQEFRDKSGKVLGTLWEARTETASRLRNRIEAVLSWATVSGFRTGDNPARWTGNLIELLPNPLKIAKK